MKYLVVIVLLMVGCATNAPMKEAAAPNAVSAPIAKPSVRLVGHTIEKMGKASCSPKAPTKEDEKQLMDWSSACVVAGQWKQVEVLANQTSVKFPKSAWGPYFLSLSAEHAKDWPRARWMAELAVKNAPNEGLVLYQLGRIQWKMDERDLAFQTLEKAADKNSSLVEANVLLGQLALVADHNSEASRYFAKAVAEDAKHFGALMGMAEVGFRARAWDEVEIYLRQAIQVRPRSLQARLRLAEGQEILAKNNADALQSYLEIQKLEKSHKLDEQPSFDIAIKVQSLQASMAEQLKKKISAERQPSDERKVSK